MRLRPQGDDSDFSDLGFDSDEEDSDLFTYLKLSKVHSKKLLNMFDITNNSK